MKNLPKTGLVSVSFRKLSVPEIIDLCVHSGCQIVEWGGDVHVPPEDISNARETARLCAEKQLQIAAYGSYCRLGNCSLTDIENTVATAAALGAPVIRVWAGTKGSEHCTPDERSKVAADARLISEMAEQNGMRVGLEFHSNTLTDTTASTLKLLEEVNHPNLRTLWQVPVSMTSADAEKSLEQVLPWLSHLHVFHWWPTSSDRHPLLVGAEDWQKYLRILKKHDLAPDLLLEFLPQDDPQTVPAEIATLQHWVSEIYTESR